MMWAAVVLAGLTSYLLRAVPMFALRGAELPPRVSRAMQHAAMGAMTAMLVVGARHAAGPGAPWGTGAVVRVIGVVGGVGVALVLGRRGRSMPVSVGAGLVVFGTAVGVAALVG